MSSEQMEEVNEVDLYEVEKIVDKRIKDGKVEYLIKWEGWPHSSNNWEIEENVQAPELIAKFEEKRRRQSAAESRARHEPKVKPLYSPGELTGFDRGLIPEAITGVTKIGDEVIYFIKWKDEVHQGIVPAAVADSKCPQLVVNFMQNNLHIPHENEASTSSL